MNLEWDLSVYRATTEFRPETQSTLTTVQEAPQLAVLQPQKLIPRWLLSELTQVVQLITRPTVVD